MTFLAMNGLFITFFSYEIFAFRETKYKESWDNNYGQYLMYVSLLCSALCVLIYPFVMYLDLRIICLSQSERMTTLIIKDIPLAVLEIFLFLLQPIYTLESFTEKRYWDQMYCLNDFLTILIAMRIVPIIRFLFRVFFFRAILIQRVLD